MADKQDFDVDGRLLSQLRVVDLKQELEKRGLSKSGSKKDLMDRLRVQLQLESLQQQASQDEGHVPNLALQEDAMGEQSDLIKEYLAKQQKIYEIQKEARRKVEMEEEMKKQTPESGAGESTEVGQGDASTDMVKPAVESENSNKPEDMMEVEDVTKEMSGAGEAASIGVSESEKTKECDEVQAVPAETEKVQPKEEEISEKKSAEVSEVDAEQQKEKKSSGKNLPADNGNEKTKEENYPEQTPTTRSLRPRLRRDGFHVEQEPKKTEHVKEAESTPTVTASQKAEESARSRQRNRVKLRRDASSCSSSSSRSQSPGVVKKGQETSSNGSSSRDQSPSESVSSNGTADLKTSRFKSGSKSQAERSDSPSVEPIRKSRRLNRSQTSEEPQTENSEDALTTQAEEEEVEPKVEDSETNDTEKPTIETSSMDVDSKSESTAEQPTAENVKEDPVKPAMKVHVRKVSLSSSKEASNKENLESQIEGEKPVRKRKWGSTAANTNKKTSIAISTDSLKSLIPDVKPLSSLLASDNALDFNEGPISDNDDSRDNLATNKEVRIVRTITQTKKDDDNESNQTDEKKHEEKTTTHTKPLSLMDEPVGRAKSPSPARNPVSRIIHIRNLVRPFTINQLKELLGRTGTLVEGGFWTDKIKSKCYATYETQEQAMTTRQTLHGTQWPLSNPKNLIVDFADDDELQFHMSLTENVEPPKMVREIEPPIREPLRRAKEMAPIAPKPKDQKPPAPPPPIREWDRVKIGERSPGERERRKRSMSPQAARERKRERGREGRDNKRDRKDRKKEEEAPAKLLDDLFKKTKSTPCIYWLPLTLEQIKQREEDRKKRQVEREKRRQLKKDSSPEKERSPVTRDVKKPKRPEEPRSRKRSPSPTRSRPRKR